MSQEAVPDWLRNDAKGDAEPLNTMESRSEVLDAPKSREGKAKLIFWFRKFVTMGLCLLMASTALIGLSSITGVDQSGKIFVAVYMFFFASLLFVFEGVQVRSIEAVDHIFKRNFGFMYNVMGKALYIIFIAFLSFGLGEPVTLSFITGLLLALFGVAELSLYLKFPEIFD